MKNTLIILMLLLSFAANAGNNKIDKSREAKAREWMKNQSLEFIENKGQFMRTDGKVADEVLFKTSFGGCDIYITDKGLSYVFVKYEEAESPKTEKEIDEKVFNKQKFGEREEENKKVSYYRLDMNLEGANISKNNIIKENESKQGHYNYFYAHCPEGIYDVKGYGKITIKNIYKGIDWVIYTNSDSKEHPLKYDFVVHPEADYKDIKIKFLNAQSTSLSDNDSKLKIQTIAGNIEEGNLYSYQSNSHNEISSKYIIDKDFTISFDIANYDTTKTLVIDPLVWATYYGGSDVDFANSINIDSYDNIYIIGSSPSQSFPTLQLTGAYWQPINMVGGHWGSDDLFIIKFNSKGVRLWATYYGGKDEDEASSACIDNFDNLFVTGWTGSSNFPTQQQPGAYHQNGIFDVAMIIIIKFNSQGIRQWASCYGDWQGDAFGNSICSDSQNNIYITGFFYDKFPCQQLAGAYWQLLQNNGLHTDAYILKFNNLGVRIWASCYGGSSGDIGMSICSDNQDNIYMIGQSNSLDFPILQQTNSYWQPINYSDNQGGWGDLFIVKFNSLGVRQWATFYGGTDIEQLSDACIDSQGNLYLCGRTYSSDFPTQQLTAAYWQANLNGIVDAFIIKFDNQGVRKWATYYGGSNADLFDAIKTDNYDNVYLLGVTNSIDFPLLEIHCDYFDSINTDESIFFVKFNNIGTLKWSTFYESGNQFLAAHGSIGINSQNSIFLLKSTVRYNGILTIDYGNGAYYQDSCDYDFLLIRLDPLKSYQPVSISSDRNNFCINEYDNISLIATGDYIDTLKWYSEGCENNLIGLTNPLIIPSPSQTTTYFAKWKTPCDSLICDSITIFVRNCGSIWYFPNSFTPTGDGLNDVFKIETLVEFNKFKLLIFNRWGEQIFESDDKNKGWDGYYKGKQAPMGVYVYKFTGTIKNNNEQVHRIDKLTLIK